jgi:large subunit ribosomal protein L10
MSKKVKALLQKEVATRLDGVEAVAVLNPRGIGAIVNNQMRRRLREQNLRMTVVKNTLAARAVVGGKLAGFEKLLEGPSAIVYGKGVSVAVIARALLDEKKKVDEGKAKLELRGAFFDGEVYVGDKGIETASKLPTREEAVAGVIAAILGPGKKLAGALKGPGGALGGILKTIEEKAPAAAPEAAPAATEAAPAGEAAAPTADAAPAGDAPTA